MYVKKIVDLVIATCILILTSPIIILSMLLVRFFLGAPILFKQDRPGLHGEPFKIIKLRTMRDSSNEHGEQMSDAQRLTVLGKILRKTSIDELPTMINVLKGDMSIVGPRPLLMRYLPLYNEEQSRRHEVKPGVTGWAQVNGRNAISWENKFKLDVWYVDNHSFLLDCKIILRTIGKVLQRKGVTADGEATTSEFLGSKPE